MTRLSKKQVFWFLGLGFFVTYLFTRLANIQNFPIFTDEAIYLRWAQIAGNDPDWLFISLTDGKQPLFVWLTMSFMKIVNDPLLAGRLVSVFAGLSSMIGIFFLTKELFKSKPSTSLPVRQAGLRAGKIAVVAAFLYLLFPFALVYDRIALYDSLVAAFIIWSLYIEVLLVRRLKFKYAILLGVIIGFGLLNKTSANFSLILLPFSLLLFNFKDKHWRQKIVRWAFYAGTAAVIAQVIYASLRLSPFHYIIAQKDATFVYPFAEWIQHPLTFLTPNLLTLSTWLVGYATIPFLIFVFAAFFIGREYLKEKIFLLLWFLIPFAALAMFGKLLYPRYILFMTMPLLVLGAYSFYTVLHGIPMRWIKAGIFAVFMLPFVLTDLFIITDFEKARIPQSDKNQYYRGWPAGGGIREKVEILQKESIDKKIYVGTEGTFGLLPYALEIYLHDNPNVIIKGFYPLQDKPPKEMIEASLIMPTYMLFYQPCPECKLKGVAPISWKVKQIYQYKKAEENTYSTLYQILPQ